jgi:hypothetical protein
VFPLPSSTGASSNRFMKFSANRLNVKISPSVPSHAHHLSLFVTFFLSVATSPITKHSVTKGTPHSKETSPSGSFLEFPRRFLPIADYAKQLLRKGIHRKTFSSVVTFASLRLLFTLHRIKSFHLTLSPTSLVRACYPYYHLTPSLSVLSRVVVHILLQPEPPLVW